tara:strand:+ start:63 stop:236 length:174 start_codon:yes stop_codon:yes gene_type:complete
MITYGEIRDLSAAVLAEKKEKKKEEMRYCKLCKKEETQDQCSYGPTSWDRFATPIKK